MSLNKEQSQKLKPEVLESIKTIGLNKTILKYEGIIGKTTIRRWNDPSIQERDRINAKKRYDSKKDDPEFKKACADAHNRYKNTERGSKIFNEYQKRYCEENKDIIIEKHKKYYRENKDALNKKKKLYNLKNSQKMALAKRRYKQENKDRLNKSQRENYRNNPLFRAKVRVRNDINKLFSNLNKTKSKDIRSENVLGCSYEELLNHLESKFSRGMCWKNMGRWHIDHIIPISKDCGSEEEIFSRNHYTNLQPLWGVENLRKSDNDFYSTEGIQYPLDGIEDSLLLIEWDGFDDKKFYDDDDIKIILEYFRAKYDNIIKFSRDDIYNVVSDYGDEFKNYCIVDVFCVESDYNKAILPYQSIYPHLRFCSDDVDFDELVNFDCSYSKEELEREFYMFQTCEGNFDACCNQNKIVINYQPHFYEQENRLLQDPATYNKLIENRKKYLGKNEDQLSNKELLLGLKHAGMIKNPYSHFSPKWFKAFIEKYDVKRVYDPCGGWGHRLLGGLSLEKYYYNDISKRTFEGVKRIVHDFGIKNCGLYNKDSSKFVLDEEYDCVFTCPPYFNVEIYDNGKFKDKEEYLQWWKSTISCCIEGGGRYLKYFAFVISKKYKEDLKGVLDNSFSEHFSFLEEIDLRKNSMSHFSRRDGVKNVGGEVLVIYKKSNSRELWDIFEYCGSNSVMEYISSTDEDFDDNIKSQMICRLIEVHNTESLKLLCSDNRFKKFTNCEFSTAIEWKNLDAIQFMIDNGYAYDEKNFQYHCGKIIEFGDFEIKFLNFMIDVVDISEEIFFDGIMKAELYADSNVFEDFWLSFQRRYKANNMNKLNNIYYEQKQ